ncbi:MAG: ROK family protein [Tropicimonas sp.]|uniref:ROK family protein n=1 Tax=Tropicimonas sp. TaxID=2067044 RepID=UPI003A8B689A
MDASRAELLVTAAQAVRDGRAATRGDIGEILKLRSTSVSEIVGHLLKRDIIRESRVRNRGQGRPAAVLVFNPRRLGAIFITVTDQKLVAHAVDMNLMVLAQSTITPDPAAGNAAIAGHLADLVRDIERLFPDDIEIAAVVCSLSGLLDVPSATWCVSTRWPNLRNLDIAASLSGFGYRVFVMRNVDAELEGFRAGSREREDEATLLLHWGHGIGAAFASAHGVVNRDKGRFCEIGHWGLGNNQGRLCRCGNHDCLETVAALWALGPQLAEHFPDLPQDEKEIAAHLGRADIEASLPMRTALTEVLRLTTNLCRLLFPDRIVLTGPFVQSPRIFSRFVQALEDAPILSSLDQIRVSVISSGHKYEISGALREPFADALHELILRS